MTIPHEHGGNVFAVARSLGIAPERLLDFSASINPLGMAPGVRDALVGCLDRLLHYPDKGAAELKETLAEYHCVNADEIAVANGSTELIHLLPRVVQGKRALVVAPAFAEYASALEKAKWDVEYFTLKSCDSFALAVPELREKLGEGYDLLFICNPANPTGSLISKSDVADIIVACRETGTFLALDEAFIDFCEDQSAKELIRQLSRGVLLRSMTKFFGIPGLRLGYAIGTPATIASIASLQDPWTVNTAAQVAGSASLRDENYCRRTREYVSEERSYLALALSKFASLEVFPSFANYLLVRLKGGLTAAELRSGLMEKGLLIRDCSNFEGLDDGFFRIAVRLREENDVLLHGLREVLANPSPPLPSP